MKQILAIAIKTVTGMALSGAVAFLVGKSAIAGRKREGPPETEGDKRQCPE